KHEHKHLEEAATGNRRRKRGRCQEFRQLCTVIGGRDEPQTEKLMTVIVLREIVAADKKKKWASDNLSGAKE
nr:hypothetical protein [Tanacetum cinerariifolium]